jgi:5-methylcytosine-specific restriction endonuclease McrA
VCLCGNKKDIRSKSCAICSCRGYPIEGSRKYKTDKEIINAINNNTSYMAAAKYLNISRQHLTKRAKELKLDIEHFSPKAKKPNAKEKILSGIRDCTPPTVRKYFLEISKYICIGCGLSGKWNSKPLTLQLHHKDGNNKNHNRNNLQWLCPNCHSQTETYVGKRRGGV